jgi:nucleotide-binding universal stress UspA family protein
MPNDDITDPDVVVLAATDGSDLATSALRRGLTTVVQTGRLVIVTVVAPVDPSLVTGSGIAGGVMSLEQKQQLVDDERTRARALLEHTVETLDLPDAETQILEGDPGREICRVAVDLGASVIVLGTRGRGGVARFVLGSVSDHVVRNAPCPVLTVG